MQLTSIQLAIDDHSMWEKYLTRVTGYKCLYAFFLYIKSKHVQSLVFFLHFGLVSISNYKHWYYFIEFRTYDWNGVLN